MRVVRLLSCQLGMAVPTSEGAEAPVEGASGPSEICWKQERFIQASPLVATQSSWSRRKTALCVSAWTSGISMRERRRTHIPCHGFRGPWKAWWVWHISHQWISSRAFGRSRWPPGSQQYTAFTVGNL